MTGLCALFYADWRACVHGFGRGIRSPGRIVLWTVYAALLGFFFWSRVYFSRGHARAGAGTIDVTRADLFMCALVAALAFAFASGRGAIGIFRSRAEARFVIASPIAAPLAIAYLQAREALAISVRLLFSFMYFILVFGPRRLGPLAVLGDLILIVAMLCATAAVMVPRRLAARPAGIACAAAGGSLALLALVPALRDAVALSPVPVLLPRAGRILALVPTWHPGHLLLEPNLAWVFAALAVAAAGIAVLASAGRDAYPELYALSVARIDRLEHRRQRRNWPVSPRAPRRRMPAIVLAAPAGVLVLVWKSAVEFARQTPRPYIIGGSVLWCLGGFAAARFVATGEEALFATLVGVTANVLLVVGIGATNAIALEIRRPLFWLARAGLFERLCALALAQIWRTVATLELIAVSYALGGGTFIDIAVLSIGLPALVALLAGVGFAGYALFPSTVDRRGPLALLRLLVSALLLAPPLVLAIVAATVFDAALFGLAAAVVLGLIEAAALIGVAAWRLDGHIDRLPA